MVHCRSQIFSHEIFPRRFVHLENAYECIEVKLYYRLKGEIVVKDGFYLRKFPCPRYLKHKHRNSLHVMECSCTSYTVEGIEKAKRLGLKWTKDLFVNGMKTIISLRVARKKTIKSPSLRKFFTRAYLLPSSHGSYTCFNESTEIFFMRKLTVSQCYEISLKNFRIELLS